MVPDGSFKKAKENCDFFNKWNLVDTAKSGPNL